MDTNSEQHRHECEARDRLRKGYGSVEGIQKLRALLHGYRPPERIEALIDEMRRQAKLNPELLNSKGK